MSSATEVLDPQERSEMQTSQTQTQIENWILSSAVTKQNKQKK